MSKKTLDIKNKEFFRELIIENRAIANKEKRTIEVAFSSEAKVERWFGIEILEHTEGTVDLERLNNGGALLVDHNPADQVGVIESARIDSDGVGRAIVRFGKSKRAEEIWQDVLDGIRQHVSVGYKIIKYSVIEEDGKPDCIRVMEWQPYEISIVSIAADDLVGFGRSENKITKQEMIMPRALNKTDKEIEKNAVNVDKDKIRAEERTRMFAITTAADQAPFNLNAVRDEAIEKGWSLEKFRSAAFEIASSEPKPKIATMTNEMMQSEKREYSLIRALNAQLANNWENAGFEREVAQELSRSQSSFAGGLLVPTHILTRADTTNNSSLIATNHMPGQFIETLRATTLLGKLGARFLGDLNGNVSIPKQTASAEFGWLAENQKAKSSEVTTGNIILSPKHIAGLVPMTFELLRQSSPAIEQMARQDIFNGIALAIDKAGFSGTGKDNQPTGILNTSGISKITLADTKDKIPSFAEIVAMEGKLDEANALMGNIAYAFRPAVRSALKTKHKDSGSGTFVFENGEVNGYSAFSSTQLPNKCSLFGNFSDVLVGSWGVVELIPERDTETGGLKIGVHQLADIALRRAESFVKAV